MRNDHRDELTMNGKNFTWLERMREIEEQEDYNDVAAVAKSIIARCGGGVRERRRIMWNARQKS